METEVANNGSSQQPDLDKVLEKINEISKKSADGDYIFRGEPECYDKVSSNLYRLCCEYLHTEEVYFDIEGLQDNILEEVKTYIGEIVDIDETDNSGVLAELQNFGLDTNLIDFTEDSLIALFFACDDSHEEDGRVILLKDEKESDDYRIVSPRRITPRVESQKSVFVDSPTGFVEPDNLVTIPADLKFPILNYLEKYHRISIATIYNDQHEFIRRSTAREFHIGFAYQREADESKTREKKDRYYKNAIRYYTEAIKLKPNFAIAYNNRGVAYFNTGGFDAAIQDYNNSIRLNPEYAQVYNNRGVAYFNIVDFEAAIEDYNKAIDLNPEKANFYNNRGVAYDGIVDFEAAIEDFSRAIDLDPKDVRFYNGRGAAYRGAGDFEAAIEDYSRAIDLNPEDVRFYKGRGLAYRGAGDFEAAIEDFNKAIDLDPEDALFYSFRGDVYDEIGDFEAAIEDFNKAIDLDPKDARVYRSRGVAWLHLKEWQKAKADLTTAKDMGWNIVARFQKNYESVEEFEAKLGVQVPKDIAALLRRA